jgi:hypothetical protein
MGRVLKLIPWLMRSEAIQTLIQRTWLRQQRPLRMGITEVRLEV